MKGLAAEHVLARLPDLGPRWPTKGNTRPYGQAVIRREGQAAWQLLGDLQSLRILGSSRRSVLQKQYSQPRASRGGILRMQRMFGKFSAWKHR